MTPEKLLGQQVGPYHIDAVLGSGGMSRVYRAHQADGETVALKVFFPPPGADAETHRRFEREIRTVARLNHPGIVPILDAGQAGDYTYMAMRLVQGQTLADRLGEKGTLNRRWTMCPMVYISRFAGLVRCGTGNPACVRRSVGAWPKRMGLRR